MILVIGSYQVDIRRQTAATQARATGRPGQWRRPDPGSEESRRRLLQQFEQVRRTFG